MISILQDGILKSVSCLPCNTWYTWSIWDFINKLRMKISSNQALCLVQSGRKNVPNDLCLLLNPTAGCHLCCCWYCCSEMHKFQIVASLLRQYSFTWIKSPERLSGLILHTVFPTLPRWSGYTKNSTPRSGMRLRCIFSVKNLRYVLSHCA